MDRFTLTIIIIINIFKSCEIFVKSSFATRIKVIFVEIPGSSPFIVMTFFLSMNFLSAKTFRQNSISFSCINNEV